MRWEDEQYVRAYKRETPEWTLLHWQMRVIHNYLLKFMDRAGVLELGRSGWKALASATRIPLDVITFVMDGDEKEPGLLADGCLKLAPDGKGGQVLFAPNFIEAQEAKQNDATRKKTQRERAAARLRASQLGLLHGDDGRERPDTDGDVTKRDSGVHGRTNPSHLVTSRHSELSEPSELSSLPLTPQGGEGEGQGSEEALPEEPPEAHAAARADAAADASKPETAYDLAIRIFAEYFEKRYRTKYFVATWGGKNSDEWAFVSLGRLAREEAGDGAEAWLRVRMKGFLEDSDRWLVENKHPIRAFQKRLNTYSPKGPAPKSAPRPLAVARPLAEPELSSAERAERAQAAARAVAGAGVDLGRLGRGPQRPTPEADGGKQGG